MQAYSGSEDKMGKCLAFFRIICAWLNEEGARKENKKLGD